ncbi:MAG: hypothetical protein E7062_00190 [Spirochaetaceae bacterium]|nr:hypothetical protein [Spirochaetaceae bacterium]
MKTKALLTILFIFFIFGCKSTEAAQTQQQPSLPPQTEQKAPEPQPKKTEPKETTVKQQEFLRSVQDSKETITEDTFEKDKKEILTIIDELSIIMKQGDVQKWLLYITPSSKAYWSNPTHLNAISSKLPIKGLRLRSIEDYFKFVFVPSRTNRSINEIRYTSSKFIKAVQATENQDIVYYYFEKINNQWLISLDKTE